MGATTKTIGTSTATQTGNDFQGLLHGLLSGTPAAPQRPDFEGILSGLKAQGAPQQVLQDVVNRSNAWATNPQNTAPKQNSDIQNTIQGILKGQTQDPSGANAAVAHQIANPTQYANPYQSQSFQGANQTQLPTNLLQGSGMADLTHINPTSLSTYNTQAGIGSTPTSQYTGGLNDIMQSIYSHTGHGAPSASVSPDIALAGATQFDMNNPYFAALKANQDRNLATATANNNARFGAAGAGAIGTGAQYSNSNLQANAGAQNTIALQQALTALQQQDLAERGTAANVGLGSRGQDVQLALGNLSAASNQNNINSSMMQSLLGSATTARGQDFAAQGTARGQDISQYDLGLKQSMGNQDAINTRNGQDITALLQNNLQGNNFQVASANQNSDNQQANNANAFNISQLLNNFNLNNANQQGNFQGQTNQLNSNNNLNTLQLGQGVNNQSNQGIQQMLAMLFGAGNNASQLGLPQAQTAIQPSQWGQIANTGLGAIAAFNPAARRG